MVIFMEYLHLADYTEYDFYIFHDMRKIADPVYAADCYEILYIAHGTGILETKDREYQASEGDLFLTPPQTPRRLIPNPDLRGIEVYCCYFAERAILTIKSDLEEAFSDFLDFHKNKIPILHTTDTKTREIRDIIVRMIDEQTTILPCRRNVIEGYLPILLVKLLRNVKSCGGEKIYSHNLMLDTAIRYIHARLYSKVSLADIAKHLKVSPSYTCRLFQKHLGMTTAQYIHYLRVEKVKDILKNTDRPINRITDMFIMDGDYLRQVFKRQTGMTMQEYRDKYNYKYQPAANAYQTPTHGV